MMKAITLSPHEMPTEAALALVDENSVFDPDADLIATYLSKANGWPLEEAIGQAMFYRLETRDEFYQSKDDGDTEDIDPFIQAWLYTPMEVYVVTKL